MAKPFWKGPIEDGITQSLIGRFLQDPKSFYYYAILGLQEKSETPLYLSWGDCYHVGLEHYLATRDFLYSIQKMEERAQTYGLSKLTIEILTRHLALYDLDFIEYGPVKTEGTFSEVRTLPSGLKVRFRGKADGVAGNWLIEHKCKKYIDPVTSQMESPFDLQTNLYGWIFDLQAVRYDLIRIPDTHPHLPQKRPAETAAHFADRIYTQHKGQDFPIAYLKPKWLYSFTYELTEMEHVLFYQIDPLCQLMSAWYEYVTDPKFDIEDPACYGPLFYEMPIRQFTPASTDRFKGPYYKIQTAQMSLDDLAPVSSLYQELSDD